MKMAGSPKWQEHVPGPPQPNPDRRGMGGRRYSKWTRERDRDPCRQLQQQLVSWLCSTAIAAQWHGCPQGKGIHHATTHASPQGASWVQRSHGSGEDHAGEHPWPALVLPMNGWGVGGRHSVVLIKDRARHTVGPYSTCAPEWCGQGNRDDRNPPLPTPTPSTTVTSVPAESTRSIYILLCLQETMTQCCYSLAFCQR